MNFLGFSAIIALAIVVHAKGAPIDDERVLAIELIQRGEKLKNSTEEYISNHQLDGNAHLVAALEHELAQITKLSKELAAPNLTHPTYSEWLVYVHHLEEKLLYHEHRVQEELEIIRRVTKPDNGDINEAIIQLLMVAGDLIPKAQEALHKHGHTKEASAIRHELQALERLVRYLENSNKIAKVNNLKKIKQQLYRHNETLKQLLHRINHYSVYNN